MIDLNDSRNWDTPLFPVSVAAQAALTAPGTMRMWFQRGRVKLHRLDAEFEPGTIPDKPGLPRLLTLRTVLTLAAAAPLVRKGTDVADAYQATKAWTHLGAVWNGDGECPRDPAALFKEPAFTALIHYAGADADVVAVNNYQKGDLLFQFPDLFRGEPIPVAPTIVFLNKVDRYARSVCDEYLKG
jgi:hypothetical protein